MQTAVLRPEQQPPIVSPATHGMVWHDTIWYSTVWYEYGMVWYDVVWVWWGMVIAFVSRLCRYSLGNCRAGLLQQGRNSKENNVGSRPGGRRTRDKIGPCHPYIANICRHWLCGHESCLEFFSWKMHAFLLLVPPGLE